MVSGDCNFTDPIITGQKNTAHRKAYFNSNETWAVRVRVWSRLTYGYYCVTIFYILCQLPACIRVVFRDSQTFVR